MWTYEPFRLFYVRTYSDLNKSQIARETGLSRHTITKILEDRHVKTDTLERLCRTYGLRIEQVCQYKPDDNDS